MRSLAWRAVLPALFSFLLVPEHAVLLARQRAGQGSLELQAPAVERPVKIDLSGETILPNGRLITPLGTHVKVALTLTAWRSVRMERLWSRPTAAPTRFPPLSSANWTAPNPRSFKFHPALNLRTQTRTVFSSAWPWAPIIEPFIFRRATTAGSASSTWLLASASIP